jgi:hypothetical protein
MKIETTADVTPRPAYSLAQFIDNVKTLASADGETLEYHFLAADVLLASAEQLTELSEFFAGLDCVKELHLDLPMQFPVRINFSTDVVAQDSIVNGTALAV